MSKKISILPIILLNFLLCGYTPIDITDIRVAVLEQEFARVRDLSQRYISQNPPKEKSDEAQYYLGLSLLYLGEYAQAREMFKQLHRYRPAQGLKDKIQIGIIDSYLMEEYYKDAIRAGEDMLRQRSESEYTSLVLLKLARANLKLARWNKARTYLNKILDQFPNSPEFHAAQQLLEEEQYFAVQVGAFLKKDRAEDIVFALKKSGEYGYILETVDQTGRKFYRVRAGHLSTLGDAKELKTRLSKLGYPTKIYP